MRMDVDDIILSREELVQHKGQWINVPYHFWCAEAVYFDAVNIFSLGARGGCPCRKHVDLVSALCKLL